MCTDFEALEPEKPTLMMKSQIFGKKKIDAQSDVVCFSTLFFQQYNSVYFDYNGVRRWTRDVGPTTCRQQGRFYIVCVIHLVYIRKTIIIVRYPSY